MHRLRSLLSALKPTRLGVVFAVLIGLGVGFWQWSRPPRPRVVLKKLNRGFHDAFFSRDGRLLATLHRWDDGDRFTGPFLVVVLWDTSTGKKKFDLIDGNGGEGHNLAVGFDLDRGIVACRFSQDNQILFWNVATGKGPTFENFDDERHAKLIFYPERTFPDEALAPDRQTVATALRNLNPRRNSWFRWFLDLLGIQGEPSGHYVTVKTVPSGEEIITLKDCLTPVFSSDGQTLAVQGADYASLQLWDLPIRKPMGKILGLAGLAAVATLLALNALGWLRRRRSSPAQSGSSQHHEVQYLTTDKKSGENDMP